ncbi:hypothetical protein BJV74DRAFT_891188 [Russula compacta]|nr:hypothetical protein BJV74DRAFT_891188 [Russula compacta]
MTRVSCIAFIGREDTLAPAKSFPEDGLGVWTQTPSTQFYTAEHTKEYRGRHDNGDAQYRSFRLDIPASVVLMAALVLKHAYMRPVPLGAIPGDNMHRLPFYIHFLLLMLAILHGATILKILFIISVKHALAKATAGRGLLYPQRGHSMVVCCLRTNGMKDMYSQFYTQGSLSCLAGVVYTHVGLSYYVRVI